MSFSMPTRLIVPTKYPFATAWATCSIRQRYSDRPREVALGMKTISAPFRPRARAPSGKWRAGEVEGAALPAGAVEAEGPGALGEVAVVADVDADLADGRLEDRVAHVPGPEVELLPEALDVRDVGLAVLAQVRAVRVDHGGRVVVDARGLRVLLVHRRHDDHAGLLGE